MSIEFRTKNHDYPVKLKARSTENGSVWVEDERGEGFLVKLSLLQPISQPWDGGADVLPAQVVVDAYNALEKEAPDTATMRGLLEKIREIDKQIYELTADLEEEKEGLADQLRQLGAMAGESVDIDGLKLVYRKPYVRYSANLGAVNTLIALNPTLKDANLINHAIVSGGVSVPSSSKIVFSDEVF